MPIVAADWSIDRTTGNIRYIGAAHGVAGASYATVIEFHRWLGDLADDASSTGDDELDITDENPSARSTDNIITLLGNYNIDDTTSQHLYDGSIIQGSAGVDQIIYDGIVNFGNEGIAIQLIQNGAVLATDWWNSIPNGETLPGLNRDLAQGISHRFMIKVHDFVGNGGDIDGRRIVGISREFNKTYGEFSINGTSRGNNVLALSNSDDLNNQTAAGTVAAWNTDFSDTVGYNSQDVDNNTVNENYYSLWDIAPARSINDFYEYMKYITRDGETATYYGLAGELFRGITHQISYTTLTGTIDHSNPVTFGNGATAQVIADNGTDTMWVQLLTGTAPANSDSITQSTPDAASATVNVVTDRSSEIKKPFVGQSTGTAIIGSYGLGILAADLSASDKVFDLTNTQITPPNNVTFSVGGLIADEDNIIVVHWDGVSVDNAGNPAFNKNQMALNTALTTDNITSVIIGHANGDVATIPSDTPSTGYIRVTDDNGFDRRLHYSGWSGSTFTIDSTDGQEDFATVNASLGVNVYISYIDTIADSTPATAGSFVTGVEYIIVSTGTTDFTLIGAADSNPGTIFTATGAGAGTGTAKPRNTSAAFTSVYSADRDLVVLVRDGGASPIKQFITSATLGSNGGSVTAIRTSDA